MDDSYASSILNLLLHCLVRESIWKAIIHHQPYALLAYQCSRLFLIRLAFPEIEILLQLD
jgi:hypothetical protein